MVPISILSAARTQCEHTFVAVFQFNPGTKSWQLQCGPQVADPSPITQRGDP